MFNHPEKRWMIDTDFLTKVSLSRELGGPSLFLDTLNRSLGCAVGPRVTDRAILQDSLSSSELGHSIEEIDNGRLAVATKNNLRTQSLLLQISEVLLNDPAAASSLARSCMRTYRLRLARLGHEDWEVVAISVFVPEKKASSL